MDVQSGFAFKTTFFSTTHGVPLIRIRDLGTSATEARYVGESRKEFWVEPGDYLIGMDGNFRCRRWSGPAGLLNQRVCRLRNFSSRVLPEYIFYGIQTRLDAIEAATSFATVKHISARQILDIDLPLPDIDEQRRIVDVLSRAEGIMRLRRHAASLATEMIPSLFTDMFGDSAINPNGWPTHELAEVIAETKLGLVRGAKEMGDQYPIAYLRMDAVAEGYVSLSKMKRVRASPTEIQTYSLRRGDFLFNTRNSRELVGKTGLFDGASYEVIFNNNLMRIRFNDRVCGEFVNWQFQSEYVQQQLESIKRGTTTVFAIYWKDLKSVRLRVPPRPLQDDFRIVLNQIRGTQSLQSRAEELTRHLFDSLLARAFRGEL